MNQNLGGLNKSQIRTQQINDLLGKFKGEDQYIMSKPIENGPEAVKCVPPDVAAMMVVDHKGRLASEDEVKAYKTELKVARDAVEKDLARTDLAKSMQKFIKD